MRGWNQRWLDVIKEVIDLYQPDLLYSDGGLSFASAWDKADASFDDPLFAAGLQAVAHLYNSSAAANGGVNRAVYNQKDRRQEVYRIGILDIERSQEPNIKPEPWQTDTCLGDWFYHVKTEYKKPGHVIEILVDIAGDGWMDSGMRGRCIRHKAVPRVWRRSLSRRY
ncbi:alpha-L-fucosidase [Paenibacillus septentrionalis]|uniref:Alpha-L-fucosidase n=1 Tax=Paenibacillus septentrionalis TaxID=429342 RepID=A0ABW1V6V3_9BACL